MENNLKTGDVLARSMDLYIENIWFMLLFGLLGEIGLTIRLYFPAGENIMMQVINSVVSFIFQSAFAMPVVFLSLKKYGKEEVTLDSVFDAFLKWTPIYIILVSAVSLITLAGMVFLIVPGVYLSVILFISDAVLINEGADIITSMKRSRSLIEGNFWPVLWSLAIIMAVSMFLTLIGMVAISVFNGAAPASHTKTALGEVIDSLISMFIMPFMSVLTVVTYKTLRKVKGEEK